MQLPSPRHSGDRSGVTRKKNSCEQFTPLPGVWKHTSTRCGIICTRASPLSISKQDKPSVRASRLSYSHFVGESLREREYMSEDPTDGRTSNYSFTFTAVHYSNSAVRERPLARRRRERCHDARGSKGRSRWRPSIDRQPAPYLAQPTTLVPRDRRPIVMKPSPRCEKLPHVRVQVARMVQHTKQWTHWRANLTLAAQDVAAYRRGRHLSQSSPRRRRASRARGWLY